MLQAGGRGSREVVLAQTEPEIRLIIFDCDGVLVDSEPLAMQVLLKTLKRAGVAIAEDEAYRDFLGKSLSSVLAMLNAEHGLHLDNEALNGMRRDLSALFRAELKPVDHVAETLGALKSQVAVCVASSSVPERLLLSLDVTGLRPLFGGNVFSASDVAQGKPAPDLFLAAARTCGVAPQNCLVIEDSPAGIAAARAAGMRVFGFTGGTHVAAAGLGARIAAAGPGALFADMRDLPGMVGIEARGGASAKRQMPRHVVAVDVGTASVRAGVIAEDGQLVARRDHPIQVWREGALFGEYASTDIWEACCTAVRSALAAAGLGAGDVAGIAFDATCSLVVLDEEAKPLSISVEPGATRDTIAWFDHRALAEAEEASASGHRVLQHSGGVLSPEMEVPKLMWLKRHMPQTWARIGYAFDLADFLTFKATGALSRSQSTLSSKWSFMAHEVNGWPDDFFTGLGLADMIAKARLPMRASPVGGAIGFLDADGAQALGLSRRCAVAVGAVDAHAGTLGVLGSFLDDKQGLHRHLGLIAGTSSCVMALSVDSRPIKGIWGPYFGAALPGIWLNEGGQSATGALLDHIIRLHVAGGDPSPERHAAIIGRIERLRAEQGEAFAAGLHVVPDFHGNRSPLADARPMGVISGLSLDVSFDGLCALYWRSAVGIAMGLRQILETLGEAGYGNKVLQVAGGHTNSPLLMTLYAEVAGVRLETMPDTDALLMGTGMCAMTAAGLAEDLADAGRIVRGRRVPIVPKGVDKARHDRDYEIFLAMQRNRAALNAMG